MNSEIGHLMVHVINLREIGFLHNVKVTFSNSLDLIITDTYNKVKLCIVMDLLAKTIITPPKITLNSKWLPSSLK